MAPVQKIRSESEVPGSYLTTHFLPFILSYFTCTSFYTVPSFSYVLLFRLGGWGIVRKRERKHEGRNMMVEN